MTLRAMGSIRSDAGRIALLAAGVLLIALASIIVSRLVSARMLHEDAKSTSFEWAKSLFKQADVPDIANGGVLSERTAQLLNGATQVGDIYRYSIWSRSGVLIFTSERMPSSGLPGTVLERFGAKTAAAVLSGKPFIQSRYGDGAVNPHYYSISFVPVEQDGKVVGVLEVYLDQTEHRAFYQNFLLLTEGGIGLVVLLAGGIPVFMIYRNMSAHRAVQAKAKFLAGHDSLTGLLNRKNIAEAAQSALTWSSRDGSQVAVLLLDLDNFTEINDTFGHETGDQILCALAGRIKSVIRDEDVLARIGGDEFIVLQVGVPQPAGAAHLADRLLQVLAKPHETGSSTVGCRASIGVAIAPSDAEDWDKLLSCADAALKKSKASGRNTVSFFETGMDAAIRERWLLEADLRRALESNSFQLAFQPVYSLRDRTLMGFEALLRWPQGWEHKSPAEFIPVAEGCGLITPIGAWVLAEACKTAAGWKAPLKVAVNLSPVQFSLGTIVNTVKSVLDSTGLDPARLELEVTEGIWIQNTDVVLEQLEQLRKMGVSIALDDFGTGYSSLSYLWRFPFDKVKIDRSLVTGMEAESKAVAVVDTVVALGKALDLTITAEGVETPAQAEALDDAGCDQVQGYLFGRPLPLAAVNELIAKETGTRAIPAQSMPGLSAAEQMPA